MNSVKTVLIKFINVPFASICFTSLPNFVEFLGSTSPQAAYLHRSWRIEPSPSSNTTANKFNRLDIIQFLSSNEQWNKLPKVLCKRTILLVFTVSLFSMLPNRSSLLRPLWVAQPWRVTVSTGIWRLYGRMDTVGFSKAFQQHRIISNHRTRSNAPPRSQQWQIDSHLDTSRSSTGFQVARPHGQGSKGNKTMKTEKTQNNGESKRNGKT